MKKKTVWRRKSGQAAIDPLLDQTVFVLSKSEHAAFKRRLQTPPPRAAKTLSLALKNRTLVLEQAGGLLKVGEAAALLGISGQEVDKRRRANSLLAIKQGRYWCYPRAQFHDGDAIPHLPEILELMQGAGPWMTLAFLVSPDRVLNDLTPIQALLREDMRDEVISLARGFQSGNGFA